MIEITGLSVYYESQGKKHQALSNINLKLESSDICAVIGPSGCGKSTLLHILGGIVRKFEGSVSVDGNAVNPKHQRIGFIPQNYGLLEWADVYHNATLGLDIKGGSRAENKAYIEYILRELDLYDRKEEFPNRLSGGQRQRVSVARAFILKPELLLMDEPFSALDAIMREESQDLFYRVWRENRVTTLFVTHSIEEAVYIGRKIVILSPGPGSIVHIMDNPLFEVENPRMKKEYYEFCMYIRRNIEEEWIKC